MRLLAISIQVQDQAFPLLVFSFHSEITLSIACFYRCKVAWEEWVWVPRRGVTPGTEPAERAAAKD
jgi:hypothetical protein